MNDTDERSCAARGSHDEPIGHQHVDEYGRPSGFLSWRDGETRWPKSQTVPLYLAPQPTLTDKEREAVEVAAAAYADDHGERFAATLRSLLERVSFIRDYPETDNAASEDNESVRKPDGDFGQPTLTDEERDVLGLVADDAGYRAMGHTERVVRRLLERTK